MLKEIRLAGSVRTPYGSFCGAFADVSTVELGKAAVERFVGLPGILLALTNRSNFRKIPL